MTIVSYLVSKGHSIEYALNLTPYEEMLVFAMREAEAKEKIQLSESLISTKV